MWGVEKMMNILQVWITFMGKDLNASRSPEDWDGIVLLGEELCVEPKILEREREGERGDGVGEGR